MKTYVVGFVFLNIFNVGVKGTDVLLINKKKPAWQTGKYNGVGGKIEEGEFPSTAMEREFKEETGCCIPSHLWCPFCVLDVVNPEEEGEAKVHFFAHRTRERPIVENVTEEHLFWFPVDYIPKLNTIDNLKWLVPLGCASSPAILTGREFF